MKSPTPAQYRLVTMEKNSEGEDDAAIGISGMSVETVGKTVSDRKGEFNGINGRRNESGSMDIR